MHIIHSHGFCWFVQQVSHLVRPRKRFVPPNSHAKSAEPGRDMDQSPLASIFVGISSEFGEIHSSKSSKPNSKQMILKQIKGSSPTWMFFSIGKAVNFKQHVCENNYAHFGGESTCILNIGMFFFRTTPF